MIHPYGQPCPIFQSTLPMRGATFKVALTAHFVDISIHAPHAGSDVSGATPSTRLFDFNPRSPCGERLLERYCRGNYLKFQSTLPMRGATWSIPNRRSPSPYFNPRSPCGERLHMLLPAEMRKCISIHAPHAGSDHIEPADYPYETISIHAPHAGSDPRVPAIRPANGISIHAPHAGSDAFNRLTTQLPAISIHAPHAGSDSEHQRHDRIPEISIHAPHAGSDGGHESRHIFVYISIHAPHAGSDLDLSGLGASTLKFQSTLPMRGATYENLMLLRSTSISIHAPHAGSDDLCDS